MQRGALLFLLGLAVGVPAGLLFAPGPAKPKLDFMDPDNSPPAFEPMGPHPFNDTLKSGGKSRVCVDCGGGRNHAVHQEITA